MVKQYPHKIEFSTVTASTLNGSGNWQGGSSTDITLDCRYEPNSGKGVITGPDGSVINYEGIVYMKPYSVALAPGTQVTIKNGAEVLLKSTIKRFSNGQLNARIWL